MLLKIKKPRASIHWKKSLFYGFKNPHHKLNTVWWPSQVYNGNPYINKTFKWIGPEFMKVAQEQNS